MTSIPIHYLIHFETIFFKTIFRFYEILSYYYFFIIHFLSDRI